MHRLPSGEIEVGRKRRHPPRAQPEAAAVGRLSAGPWVQASKQEPAERDQRRLLSFMGGERASIKPSQGGAAHWGAATHAWKRISRLRQAVLSVRRAHRALGMSDRLLPESSSLSGKTRDQGALSLVTRLFSAHCGSCPESCHESLGILSLFSREENRQRSGG